MAKNKIEEIKSEIMIRKRKGLENKQIENVFYYKPYYPYLIRLINILRIDHHN